MPAPRVCQAGAGVQGVATLCAHVVSEPCAGPGHLLVTHRPASFELCSWMLCSAPVVPVGLLGRSCFGFQEALPFLFPMQRISQCDCGPGSC